MATDGLAVRVSSPRPKEKRVARASGLPSPAVLLAALVAISALSAHAQPRPDDLQCSPEFIRTQGLEYRVMPDVVGCKAEIAGNALRGLEPLSQHGTSERPAGVVYRQYPDAGKSVQGLRPVLWISDGAPVVTDVNIEVRGLPNKPDTITVGGNDRFLFAVRNNGPAMAYPVRISGAWERLAAVRISGACSALPCEIPRLPPGSQVQVSFEGRVEASSYVASLTATADQVDQDPANNMYRFTRVLAEPASAGPVLTKPAKPSLADLRIVQTELPGSESHVDGLVRYRIEMTNLGPSEAQDVSLVHETAHLELLGSSAPQFCVGSSCRFDRVQPDETISWNYEFRITAPGLASSNVSIRAKTDDPVLSNNAVTLSKQVPPQPEDKPWWPWILAAIAAAVAATAAHQYRRRWWARRIRVTPALEPMDGISIGSLPFDAPPLSIGVTIETGEAGPLGSIPVRREEMMT